MTYHYARLPLLVPSYEGLYTYPGWPAWVPSTSLQVLPLAGLGATGGGGLGASRLMGRNELLQVGKLYTYRTYSLVPLQENASWRTGWTDLVGRTAWDNHRRGANAIRPPGTIPSLYQSAHPEAYSGSVSGYRGRQVYNTSLTFTPTRSGVTAAQASTAAVTILNQMRSSFSDDEDMKVFDGNLYERGVADTTTPEPGLLDRAREIITGQDPAEAARERAQEAAASDQRMLYARIGAGVAVILGIFLATRKGSAKVERQLKLGERAEGAIGGAGRAVKGAGSLALGAATGGASRLLSQGAKVENRRRRRRNPGGGEPWQLRVLTGNRTLGMLAHARYQVDRVLLRGSEAMLNLSLLSGPWDGRTRKLTVWVRYAKHLANDTFNLSSGDGVNKVKVQVVRRRLAWTEADLPLPDFTKNRRTHRRR